MTARNIKDTLCALAVGSLFATSAFAQDSQGMPESGNTLPTQTQEPTQESEDYQNDYRGKDDAKDMSSDGAHSDRGSQNGMGGMEMRVTRRRLKRRREKEDAMGRAGGRDNVAVVVGNCPD